MTSPAVSVVIPTFRRPSDLRRTLASLAEQRPGIPWEIVVCDDGSPEPEAAETAAEVHALAERHLPEGPAISLLRQENAGPAAARNAGARGAAAPLLVFLDDDCAPAPGWLQRHLAAHQAQPDVAVLGHVAWDPSVRVTPFMELVVRGAQFNYGAITDPQRVPFTCFYTANCSLRREHLEAAGWFDATLPPYMEDTEFAYRLVSSGTRVVYERDAIVYHSHAVALAPYLERQRKAGRAAVLVAERHPELFDVIGVGAVADVGLREQFYSALLRYAFLLGVEDELANRVSDGRVTGAELHSQIEGWIAQWATHQAEAIRAWRERATALADEVAARDRRIADVVQEKDERIAMLEVELARLHALPPVRLLRAARRLIGTRPPRGSPPATATPLEKRVH
jgi:GT2 family glycosyltransferase